MKIKNFINFKQAFTLAEVLITLSILGVVAAISVPNIIQQYQKRLTVTKLQKAYANLEIAANNIAISTGCLGRDLSCTNILNKNDKKELAESFIKLSLLKDAQSKSNSKWIYKNGDNDSKVELLEYIIKTNNPYSIGVKREGGFVKSCSETLPIYNDFLKIYIFTEPNAKQYILGKNVFLFLLQGDFQVIVPTYNSFSKYCPASTGNNIESRCTNDGYSCVAKIINDGWKMNY